MNKDGSNNATTGGNDAELEPLQGKGPSDGDKKRSAERIKVFGFDVTNYLRTNATLVFVAFSLCHIAFSIIFASLQEIVNGIEGFKFPEFMTISYVFYSIINLFHLLYFIS